MIILDDRLSLELLAGRLDIGRCSTTWGFHYRLNRAIASRSGRGTLSRSAGDAVMEVVANPPEDLLVVLDPRDVTVRAAEMALRHSLNLLAAEMVASAVHHRAELYLSAPNVGRSWPEVLAREGVALTVL